MKKEKLISSGANVSNERNSPPVLTGWDDLLES